MNILHISPYFPSTKANHAGGVCMGKEIETLQKWHQVYVLTFEASEFDAGPYGPCGSGTVDAKLLCSQKLFQVRMEADLSGEKI